VISLSTASSVCIGVSGCEPFCERDRLDRTELRHGNLPLSSILPDGAAETRYPEGLVRYTQGRIGRTGFVMNGIGDSNTVQLPNNIAHVQQLSRSPFRISEWARASAGKPRVDHHEADGERFDGANSLGGAAFLTTRQAIRGWHYGPQRAGPDGFLGVGSALPLVFWRAARVPPTSFHALPSFDGGHGGRARGLSPDPLLSNGKNESQYRLGFAGQEFEMVNPLRYGKSRGRVRSPTPKSKPSTLMSSSKDSQ
jgi:hypothetical protein